VWQPTLLQHRMPHTEVASEIPLLFPPRNIAVLSIYLYLLNNTFLAVSLAMSTARSYRAFDAAPTARRCYAAASFAFTLGARIEFGKVARRSL